MNAITEISRLRTWTPAVLCKTPDNIVSSDYTNIKQFVPSYEKCEPCIEQLLTNEYQRIWWQEKRIWDQNIITRQITGARKKILPRKLIKKRIPSCVTVIYRTRAEQLDEKTKKKITQKIKERSGMEETKFAKDDVKSEKSRKAKLEKHEECEDTKSQREDTVSNSSSEKRENIKSEKLDETRSKENEKLKVEEVESKTLEEKVEEENSVNLDEEKLQKRKETKLENDKDKKLKE